MGDKNNKSRLSKGNVIILVVLLALVLFLFGTDAFSWLGDTGLKIVIGVAIVLVIFISITSMNKRHK